MDRDLHPYLRAFVVVHIALPAVGKLSNQRWVCRGRDNDNQNPTTAMRHSEIRVALRF